MEEIIAMFVAGFVKNSETIIWIILAMYAALTIVLVGCALVALTLTHPPRYGWCPIDEFRSRYGKTRMELIAPWTRERIPRKIDALQGLRGKIEPILPWVILLTYSAACFYYQLTYYPGDYFGDQIIRDIADWIANLDIKIKIFLGLTSVALISYDYLTLPIYGYPICGCCCGDHRHIEDDQLRSLLLKNQGWT